MKLVIVLCFAAACGLRAETILYTYDDAGRLTRADYGGGTKIDYVYDANGNLLMRTVAGGGVPTYTLIYLAGAGGTVGGLGSVTQHVAAGQSGAPVHAAGADASAVFGRWSDGLAAATRTDMDVQTDLTVSASFRSTNGADLDWYAARGLVPGTGEDWSDVDARPVAVKGTSLLHENLADTDPGNPDDVFRVTAISNGPPATVVFVPASMIREYTLQAKTNLGDTVWSDIPGQGPRPGGGGTDVMTDAESAPSRFYRIKVQLP